jgi:RimJ/RimL family protein N-acetyltransferase
MIETERLILRSWRDEDVDPFADICADPRVMATLGPLMTRDETAALIERVKERDRQFGYTFWAVERKADSRLIGWCGVLRGPEGLPIEDKPEIGWRLAHDTWGQGYAREAAQASIDWAFANLPDDAVWAITSTGNSRSWGLMERLGMTRRHDLDFAHPKVADDSPLKQHVTYELKRPA